MSDQNPFTEVNIKEFVAAWYRALDFRVPLNEIYALLTANGLNMQFPDGDIRDFDSFCTWYNRVINIFFDENHYVQSVEISLDGNEAVLDVVVGWQASWWVAPEAKSKRVSMDATQQWTVRKSDRNIYSLEIVSYNATVEPFKYAPGFARL